MRGERVAAVAEPADVDDLPHARLARGMGEVTGRRAVLDLEAPGRAHRVDQIVCARDAFEGGAEAAGIQNVSGDHLRASRHARPQEVRPPGEAAQGAPALFLEQLQQPAANVPRRAGQKYHARDCTPWSGLISPALDTLMAR